jgi:sulfate adenylyltransferase
MFYAGPKEAIMHGIYRQNFGFTDIIIGRKHADAPYDDGKDIWDPLDAQRKFDQLKGDLKIKPVKVGFAAYYEELGRVGLVEECAPKGYHQVNISGRELREKLRKGELPDPRVMRPETAKILIERMAVSPKG